MKNYTFLFSLLFLSAQLLAQTNLNWVTLATGTTKKINDIYFHNPDTGYIVGENYLFKKTTDGGATWFDLTPPSIGEKPNNNGNIIGIDHHSSFNFSSLDSGLYLTWEKGYHGVSTSDEGASYSIFAYLDSNQFCEIKGFSVLPDNQGNGYINLFTYGQNCNGDAVYFNFYDGPFSITSSKTSISNKTGRFTSVDVDSFSSIFGHDNGYLLKYGSAFSPLAPDSIYLDSNGISAVAYAGNNTWYAASNKGASTMYVSRDSGNTFTVDQNFSNNFYLPKINDFSFSSNGTGIAVALEAISKGLIVVYHSNTWDFYPAPHYLYTAKLFDNGIAYVAGDSGLVMKTTLLTSLSSIEMKNVTLKVSPNPTTNFIYLMDLDHLTIDSIQLYDIHGKLIRNFAPQTRKIDLSSDPQGSYLIVVQTKEGNRMSQKIIVK